MECHKTNQLIQHCHACPYQDQDTRVHFKSGMNFAILVTYRKPYVNVMWCHISCLSTMVLRWSHISPKGPAKVQQICTTYNVQWRTAVHEELPTSAELYATRASCSGINKERSPWPSGLIAHTCAELHRYILYAARLDRGALTEGSHFHP